MKISKKGVGAGILIILILAIFASADYQVWDDGNQTANDWNVTDGNYNVEDLNFHAEIQPDGATCSNTEILKKTGADNWDCAADDDTTYTAGSGIGLSGTEFSVAAGFGLNQDASGLSADHTILANQSYVGTLVSDVGASAPITSSGGTTPSIGITIAGDLVAGLGLSGGADNIIPGNDADYTISANPAVLVNWSEAISKYLNYTSSCSAGEIYVWGTGCRADAVGTVTDVTGAAPITSSGGATPEIGITLTGDITLTGQGSVTGGTNSLTAGQSVTIVLPEQPSIAGENITEGTVGDARLSSNIMYLDGTRPLTGDWAVDTNSITGVADLLAANVNASAGISLPDNAPQCFGDACDACQFWNGTHLRTAKPCPV